MITQIKLQSLIESNAKELKRVAKLINESPDLELSPYLTREGNVIDPHWTYKIYLNVLIARDRAYREVNGCH